MNAKTGVSVEEYLRTSFGDLDREYREGEVVERTMPDYLHGRTQLRLAGFFHGLEEKGVALFACTETRMRLSANTVLIPDAAVFWPEEPKSRVPEEPPLIVVEILSPDDRMQEVRQKLAEYRTWGVAHVWLVDPYLRRLYECDEGLREVSSFSLPELSLEIGPTDVFAS